MAFNFNRAFCLLLFYRDISTRRWELILTTAQHANRSTVDDSGWDSNSWMGQLPKALYNCQNVTQMNMLLHVSPRHTSCKFHDILTTLRMFWKLSHSAVTVPHNCRPLYHLPDKPNFIHKSLLYHRYVTRSFITTCVYSPRAYTIIS